MNLKAKQYEQRHKEAAAESLNARIAELKDRGVSDALIDKDPRVRKFRAEGRQATRRLMRIAAMEKLSAGKLKAKAEKAAARKSADQANAKGAGKQVSEKPQKKEKKPKRARESSDK